MKETAKMPLARTMPEYYIIGPTSWICYVVGTHATRLQQTTHCSWHGWFRIDVDWIQQMRTGRRRDIAACQDFPSVSLPHSLTKPCVPHPTTGIVLEAVPSAPTDGAQIGQTTPKGRFVVQVELTVVESIQLVGFLPLTHPWPSDPERTYPRNGQRNGLIDGFVARKTPIRRCVFRH